MGITDLTKTSTGNGSKPTLLIVDDEPGPRESLRIVFKDRFNCAVATCGREGVDYARQHTVDAAILDIKMPDMSGVDVLKELKEIDPHTECVMLTGYETLETARAAIRYGASDYLHKPFDVFFIRDLIEKCMNRRRQKATAAETMKSLQQMNDELSRELAQQNRAVTAGVISAGVVHELNNPLTIIAGYVQLLSRDLTKLQEGDAGATASQNIQTRMTSIQREISRCKDIARRFLSFSRTRQSNPESIGVAYLLEDAAALIKAHPVNKGVEIILDAGDPDLRLRAFPGELLQVLINLAVNAVEAMQGKGQLRLSAAAVPTAPATCLYRSPNFNPQLPLVTLAVADTGPGIPAETLQKIFQPYFTTKEHGTGIGLAIVSELVNQYAGAVDVRSEPGRGTTVNVYLPRESSIP